jgi:hypothetical protein
MAADVTMATNQFTTAHVVGKDSAGNAGEFSVPPTWAADNTLVKLTPTPDGASCRIEAEPPGTTLGISVVTVTYAPSSGPTLTSDVHVTLTAPPLATLEVTVDPPQDLL